MYSAIPGTHSTYITLHNKYMYPALLVTYIQPMYPAQCTTRYIPITEHVACTISGTYVQYMYPALSGTYLTMYCTCVSMYIVDRK